MRHICVRPETFRALCQCNYADDDDDCCSGFSLPTDLDGTVIGGELPGNVKTPGEKTTTVVNKTTGGTMENSACAYL